MNKLNNIKLLLIVLAFIIILYLYSVINQDKEGYASTQDFKSFYDDLDRSFPTSNTAGYNFRLIIMGTLFETYQKFRAYPTSINQKIISTTSEVPGNVYSYGTAYFIFIYILLFDSKLTSIIETSASWYKGGLAYILIKFSLFLPNPTMITNNQQLAITITNIYNRCRQLYINSLPPSTPDNIDNEAGQLLMISLRKYYTDYINGNAVLDNTISNTPVVSGGSTSGSTSGSTTGSTTTGSTIGSTTTGSTSGSSNIASNVCDGCLYNGNKTVNFTPAGCSLCPAMI
jgi:hypothetical protein